MTTESEFEDADLVSVFPTFIWNFQLKRARFEPLNAGILNVLAKERRALAPLERGESWQFSNVLHEEKASRGLVLTIEEGVRHAFEFLKVGYRNFTVTGCWANVNAPGTSHGMHSHPNNFLSGVYYVQTQVGADTINFHDPRMQTGIIRPPVTDLTAHNTDQVVVRVKSGTLLMFPSYMQHSVSRNESNLERISISFNIMFTSFAEELGKPLW